MFLMSLGATSISFAGIWSTEGVIWDSTTCPESGRDTVRLEEVFIGEFFVEATREVDSWSWTPSNARLEFCWTLWSTMVTCSTPDSFLMKAAESISVCFRACRCRLKSCKSLLTKADRSFFFFLGLSLPTGFDSLSTECFFEAGETVAFCSWTMHSVVSFDEPK